MALLDDKVISENTLKSFAVNGRPGAKSFKLHVKSGTHKVAVKILDPKSRPAESDPKKRDRAIVFDNVSIRGPMPARESLPSATYKPIMVAHPSKDLSETECPAAFAKTWLAAHLRRPVTKDEVDRLVRLVEMTRKHGDSFDQGIHWRFRRSWCRQHFLFKVEHDGKLLDRPFPITEHELATRLSYFLWSSMPDDELFRLADRREIAQKDLESQVRRMLKDPKADALGDNSRVNGSKSATSCRS